jgi:peptidoglycan/LPS O-acetylase OafA/YrhL
VRVQDPGRNDALDGLRGFAVLLVFLVHASGNLARGWLGVDLDRATLRGMPSPPEQVLFWVFRSQHGVFLFFVLSGFLIGRLWWPRARLSYGAFALRRTLRIYPAFLLAFALSLLFARIVEHAAPGPARALANLLLLNGLPELGVRPLNTVTWSLFYEMAFYLLFPLVALAAARAGALGWRALPFIGVAAPYAAVALGADPVHLCWSLLFVGVAAARYEQPLRRLSQRLPAAVPVLLYLGVTTPAAFDLWPPMLAVLLFGLATALLVGQCITGGNALAQLFGARPLVLLGRVSYSFYLLHWMIVVLLAEVFAPRIASVAGGAWLLFAGGLALSALAASASWWWCERPYFRWFARREPPIGGSAARV